MDGETMTSANSGRAILLLTEAGLSTLDALVVYDCGGLCLLVAGPRNCSGGNARMSGELGSKNRSSKSNMAIRLPDPRMIRQPSRGNPMGTHSRLTNRTVSIWRYRRTGFYRIYTCPRASSLFRGRSTRSHVRSSWISSEMSLSSQRGM